MLSQKVWRLTSASTLPFPLTAFPTQPTMKELSLNYFWVIRCLLPSQHPCLLSTNLHPTAERVVDTAGERTLKVLEKGEQGEGGGHTSGHRAPQRCQGHLCSSHAQGGLHPCGGC